MTVIDGGIDTLCRIRHLTPAEAGELSRDQGAVSTATQALQRAKGSPEARAQLWPYGLENAWAILRAAYRARPRERIEATELRVVCPKCEAGPGAPCVFGRKAAQNRVHLPRSDRAARLRDEEQAAELAALRELFPDPDWSAR